ncbi:uncharacterized protein LOC113215488 [Frankliniella occidentalis]|uniref:Uncharacterized protein LOC113215488 n=1 Tax=Frankliniella occidentalis TaxID=133901 RepID=A0A6J1TGP7_FRAOC|nr:uncharacterized protein LOC113215488 [Frankliniella occidentalis]
MHFVSILRSVQVYCSHVDVMDSILNEPPPEEGYYTSDFRTGSEYGKHPLFQREPRALRIRLFADDLDYTDALKGNQGRHQTLGVTFQIENVGPKYLSNQDSIHLALLVRTRWVKRFGRDVLMRPVLDELRELAEVGVEVSVKDGRRQRLFGAVAVFVGDNKAVHEFAGMGGFSSGEVCRFCTVDHSELTDTKSEDQCTLRTHAGHSNQVEAVVRFPETKAAYPHIKGPSVLLQIPHFTFPNQAPFDPLHDALTSFLALTLKACIRGLHRKRADGVTKATLQKLSQPVRQGPQYSALHGRTLRRLIDGFEWGPAERANKPPPLHFKVHLKGIKGAKRDIKGSCVQKMNLMYIFSLALAGSVPEGNPFWKMHLAAVRIVEIILAVRISNSMLSDLVHAVRLHHDLWVKHVGDQYTPKMHYIMNYALQTTRVGCPRVGLCLTFEGFHLYQKRIIVTCNNFTQVTKTASERIQKKRALLYPGENCLRHPIDVTSCQRDCPVIALPHPVREALMQEHGVDAGEVLGSVLQLKVHGTLVRRGSYNVMAAVEITQTVVFLRVDLVVVRGGTAFACGYMVASLDFSNHIHAFEIPEEEEEANFVVVDAALLHPAQTLEAHTIAGKRYLKLRHALF